MRVARQHQEAARGRIGGIELVAFPEDTPERVLAREAAQQALNGPPRTVKLDSALCEALALQVEAAMGAPSVDEVLQLSLHHGNTLTEFLENALFNAVPPVPASTDVSGRLALLRALWSSELPRALQAQVAAEEPTFEVSRRRGVERLLYGANAQVLRNDELRAVQEAPARQAALPGHSAAQARAAAVELFRTLLLAYRSGPEVIFLDSALWDTFTPEAAREVLALAIEAGLADGRLRGRATGVCARPPVDGARGGDAAPFGGLRRADPPPLSSVAQQGVTLLLEALESARAAVDATGPEPLAQTLELAAELLSHRLTRSSNTEQ